MPFELQRGYTLILDEAVRHNCRFWLLDVCGRNSGINPNDVNWIVDNFLPHLYARLGGATYIAYLMAPHQLAGFLADTSIPNLDPPFQDNQPYYTLRFTDEQLAMRWLQHCRIHDVTPNARASALPIGTESSSPAPTPKKAASTAKRTRKTKIS
jgi:hypothetical protein